MHVGTNNEDGTTTLYNIGADVCHTEVAVSVKNKLFPFFLFFSIFFFFSKYFNFFTRAQVSFLFHCFKSQHVRKIVNGPRDTKYEHASE